jgi:hypothetical protein
MAAALSLATITLASCGGSSSSSDQTAKFKAAYKTVTGQLRTTSQAVGAEIQKASSQTDAQIYSAFRGFASSWQMELSQLETLKPPASVAATFNSLTAAASRAVADLNAIAAAAATHSKTAAEQAAASLVSDVQSAKTANTAIRSKLGIK